MSLTALISSRLQGIGNNKWKNMCTSTYNNSNNNNQSKRHKIIIYHFTTLCHFCSFLLRFFPFLCQLFFLLLVLNVYHIYESDLWCIYDFSVKIANKMSVFVGVFESFKNNLIKFLSLFIRFILLKNIFGESMRQWNIKFQITYLIKITKEKRRHIN